MVYVVRMGDKVKLRARYSGNGEVCYRRVGAIDGAALVPAQCHLDAEPVEDGWSAQVDARIARKTVVRLPVGLLVLDSSHDRAGGHVYSAGVLVGKPGVSGGGDVDWSRARHVDTIEPDRKRGTPRRHVVDVDGVRRTYIEA